MTLHEQELVEMENLKEKNAAFEQAANNLLDDPNNNALQVKYKVARDRLYFASRAGLCFSGVIDQ